jgi:hypothetical protein
MDQQIKTQAHAGRKVTRPEARLTIVLKYTVRAWAR